MVKKKNKIVNCRNAQYDVYIGRPSKWGNPFTHKKSNIIDTNSEDREDSIKKYEEWIRYGEGKYLLEQLHELEGKILGCWCKPKKCHGDILIKLLNEKEVENIFDFDE